MTELESPTWLTAQEQTFWRAYLRGSRLLENELNSALDGFGVQLTEYELISMLSEAPGGRLRMSLLADAIVQSRSRVTHTAARLEARGWVRRESCLEDKRGVELVLTESGRQAIEDMAWAHVKSVRDALVDALTPEEFAALGHAMEKVREHLHPGHQEPASAQQADCDADGDRAVPDCAS
ncbi:MarR family winged helix-turn-helix transcriptional regulator [Kribbia dieselivorans]|uniref:MarR family winged helix-turn-helix transcriptional regulator n=1 Tax=Kribbia dieselivorans TaxID=331526 RepID=UPI000837F568|nr:MarR family transcriptional regulator [Kribbia dieselivorans]